MVRPVGSGSAQVVSRRGSRRSDKSSRSASSRTPGLSKPDTETRRRIADAYDETAAWLRGQSRPDRRRGAVRVTRRGNYPVLLTATEAVLTLRAASPETAPSTSSTPLRMKLADGNPMPRVSQSGELAEKEQLHHRGATADTGTPTFPLRERHITTTSILEWIRLLRQSTAARVRLHRLSWRRIRMTSS